MLVLLLLLLTSPIFALNVYHGQRPQLRHAPFGFGGSATGGSTNTSAVYVVSNRTELWEAMSLPFVKTIYVNGTIHGNQLHNGSFATCQDYIDMTGTNGSAVRQFNFTLYLLSLNSTYLSLVEAAAAENVTFEGQNATEYRTLLGHQNGYRPVVLDTQKAQVGLFLTSNTSLIGLDQNAALDGINLYLSSVNNVWIRNLKLVSPADCFPAPETYPSTWNAEYDAVGLVTSTNVWLDGCDLQDQLNGEFVQPDIIPPGWIVDRFDGLFDCEDGTDNVTFSHNIVRNHHKSMLLGGGTKEADRDLGKMHFTIFGNHFNGSASRNPLMRFGSYDVFANVYQDINNKTSLFDTTSSLSRRQTTVVNAVPPDAVFEYNLGVYNQSRVQVQDNIFIQGGIVPNDTSRIFSISESTNADLPAKLCIHENSPGSFLSTINGAPIRNLSTVAQDTIDFFVQSGKSVEGGVILTCDGFEIGYELPQTFSSAEEVQAYVFAEAGQQQ